MSKICREKLVELEYYDIWGRLHQPSEHTLRAILASLGFDTQDESAMQNSWAQYERSRRESILDPVTVATAGEPIIIGIRPFPEEAAGSVRLALYPEEGEAGSVECSLAELPWNEHRESRDLTLPWSLPMGYYDIEVELTPGDVNSARRASQRLVVAPKQAYMPERLRSGGRMAGIAVSLYGIRSDRNWGAGDFADLQRFVQWAASELGVSIVALNPLHSIHNREPYNTSPYLPLSAYYRNYLYLAVEELPDFTHCPSAQQLLRCPEVQARIENLRASEFVDYEGVARLKRVFLRLLFREFLRRHWFQETPRASAFKRYLAEEGTMLRDYATYCALDEVLHAQDRTLWIWPDWPDHYQHPDSPATREFARQHWRRVLYHQWVQWQIDEQLEQVQLAAQQAGMEIGLYHDLALATDSCGSDLWAYRKFFASGCRVGSPPDDFSPEGQDWAFPPPQPDAHRQDGYRLFIETIRKNSRHGGALRIDHFMRFYRLYWIPNGLAAREGTYVRDHFEDLMRILALESLRGKFLVIGEDLGTCPPEVREGMARFSVLSYKLFYFEKGSDGLQRAPGEFPHLALVSSTTHDLPTLAGYWAGRDLEARSQAGLLPSPDWQERQWNERKAEKRRIVETLLRDGFLPQDFPRESAEWSELTGDLHNAIIGWLCSTPAALMLLNEEDLTKETEQQNLPGTTTEYPNWKRKMKLSLEDLTGETAAGFVVMFRSWLQKTGRLKG